jgi:hypothetical protein
MLYDTQVELQICNAFGSVVWTLKRRRNFGLQLNKWFQAVSNLRELCFQGLICLDLVKISVKYSVRIEELIIISENI